MRLNLACGSDYRPGWANWDVTAWPGYTPPDRLWDARSGKIDLPDDSVEEVYAGYLLLHIFPTFRQPILKEIFRVLVPWGFATFVEVDQRAAMERWLKDPRDKAANEMIWGEVGSIHGQELADFDRHTHGYCESTLRDELNNAGFPLTGMRRVKVHDVWYDLSIDARKT